MGCLLYTSLSGTYNGLLLCPFSLEDGGGGAQDAEGVQVQGAVGDVVVLQLQALLVLYVGTPVAAPPTREAWLCLLYTS